MKVALIGDDFTNTDAGIARYGYELTAGLSIKGLHIQTIKPSTIRFPCHGIVNHSILFPFIIPRISKKFDVVHAVNPINALSFPLIKTPKVVTYHDLFSLLYKDIGSACHVRMSSPLFQKIGFFADKIISNSSQTKKELVTYLKIPEKKIIVIPLGVDNKFKFKTQTNKDTYIIGYIGSMLKHKRIDYLIRSFNILKKSYPGLKVKVLIIGHKAFEYPQLKELAKKFNLNECIEFVGRVPEDKIVTIYHSFDVFVLPSDWEGFGLPILEAQKCGVPVIIREDARIPRETSKFCLKAKSEKDMANIIYNLFTDTSFRTNVSKEGRNYSEQFTWERTIEETIKVYESITC